MLKLTTATTTEPLTTAEVKTELIIDHSNWDDRIANFILPAARQMAEGLTFRAFANQTYTLKWSSFPHHGAAIILPRPPLSSVTSVTYIDTAGSSQTWSSSKYTVTEAGAGSSGDRDLWGSIEPTHDESVYPQTRRIIDAVTITFVAGYGAAASAIPEGIKHGTVQLCQYLLDGDEDAYTRAEALLGPYLAWRPDLRFD